MYTSRIGLDPHRRATEVLPRMDRAFVHPSRCGRRDRGRIERGRGRTRVRARALVRYRAHRGRERRRTIECRRVRRVRGRRAGGGGRHARGRPPRVGREARRACGSCEWWGREGCCWCAAAAGG
jgi:hypothetical protein